MTLFYSFSGRPTTCANCNEKRKQNDKPSDIRFSVHFLSFYPNKASALSDGRTTLHLARDGRFNFFEIAHNIKKGEISDNDSCVLKTLFHNECHNLLLINYFKASQF